MNKICAGLILLVLFWGAEVSAQETRKPVWAGRFYNGSAKALNDNLDSMLAAAAPSALTTQGLTALIVPHAGYVYSGRVAAHAYRLVRGMDIQAVVILGPAHRHGFRGCSIYPSGGYQTPLGTVAVDSELAEAIAEATGFGFVAQAHREEHAIEVQIPFIQKTLPGVKIVPILTGRPSRSTAERLAEGLSRALSGHRALILVSTDMSHYLDRDAAGRQDSATIRMIVEGDTSSLIEGMERGKNLMCGGIGVAAALMLAERRGSPRVEVLKYADSSEAGGPRDEVVGYLAAAVYSRPPGSDGALLQEEKTELLAIARRTLDLFVRERRVSEAAPLSRRLNAKRGAFVTLRKNKRLRGCIGFIEPIAPLYKTVMQAAVYAASRDKRFPPVREDELSEVEIEISVLTPPRKIQDPKSIEVGRHGLIIEQGVRRGLLLPQVPVEENWNQSTYLQQACRKAGLPRDAWEKGADIFVFEAVVFKEEEDRSGRARLSIGS